jgi:hypothetical protein
MNDEFEKELEGNNRGLIEVLSWHLLEDTEGHRENPQSGYLAPRTRFEWNTFRIHV